MENATKGLLIAAAILLAIIIISIAMYLISIGTSSDKGSSEIKALEVKAFNNKYEVHQGVRSAHIVRTVLQQAIIDNDERNETSVYKKICVRSKADDILSKFASESSMTVALNGTRNYGVILSNNITRIRFALNNSKKYKLWFSYDKSTGLIWEIHIDNPD